MVRTSANTGVYAGRRPSLSVGPFSFQPELLDMRLASFSVRHATVLGFAAASLCLTAPSAGAQQARPAPSAEAAEDPRPAPARRAGEGEGPFQRLIIRGATLIDGSGSPPRGPVDIIVEGQQDRRHHRRWRAEGDDQSEPAARRRDEGDRRDRNVCHARPRRRSRPSGNAAEGR